MFRRPRTLRGRLTLLFGLITVALSALVGVLVDFQYRTELRTALDEDLATRFTALRQELALAGEPLLKPPIPDVESFAQVIDVNGHIVAAAPRALARKPVVRGGDLDKARRLRVTLVRRIAPIREQARLRAGPAQLHGGAVVIVVGTSLEETSRAERRLALALGVGLPLLAAIVTVAGWFLAGAALAPVRELIEEADAISAVTVRGQKRRLSIPQGGEELAELARRLNELLARIEAAVEHERAFLDDASHELRTPIAIARGELELARMRAEDGSEATEALDSSLEEIERLDHLAVNLLVLARSRSVGTVSTEPIELQVVARRAIGDLSRAGDRSEIATTVQGAATTIGDEPALERAISNLVDNAWRHARTRVEVVLGEDRDEAVVEVRDDGPGFPSEILEQAFGRFVQGGGGGAVGRRGAGLGLAIVDAIAAAHGGSAEATNLASGGASVRLRLPRAHNGADPRGAARPGR